MNLIKYIGGSDAEEHTHVLAEASILTRTRLSGMHWHWEKEWPESRAGYFYLGLEGPASAGSQPDVYGLEIPPEEFGAMLAKMYRSADVQAVMGGFLERADPELIGAVVGLVITHLARRGNIPPAEPCATADRPRD